MISGIEMDSKYNHNLVFFCKTCIRDILNFLNLMESILKYNSDNIPIYISVVSSELDIFNKYKDKYNYTLLIDEEITNNRNLLKSWFTQQEVKLYLYKTNISKHYLIIDSDCYFIRNFYIRDFLYDDNTPYFTFSDGGGIFKYYL